MKTFAQKELGSRAHTVGEKLFEEYLYSQGITDFEYEKERDGKAAKVDYAVTLDREYLFEVKDFEYAGILDDGYYDPCKRLRKKIDELREKFREYKEWPCCGVLYSATPQLVDLTTPEDVLGAMFGDPGITMELHPATGRVIPNSHRQEFLSRGKMLLRKLDGTVEVRNTTIAALITLRHICSGDEQHVGVIVWENRFARMQIPRHLLCGDYDMRYGLDDDGRLRCLYAGRGALDYAALLGETVTPLAMSES